MQRKRKGGASPSIGNSPVFLNSWQHKQASPAPHFFPIPGNASSADHASLSYRRNPVQSSLFGGHRVPGIPEHTANALLLHSSPAIRGE